LFWVPYRITGQVVDRLRLSLDVRSTWKLLIGIVMYLIWFVVLVTMVGLSFGPTAALAALVLIPVTAIAGLAIRERWRSSMGDVRRFFLIRARRSLVDSLALRQRELSERLQALLDASTARAGTEPANGIPDTQVPY
jgi:hypothetical protein